MYILGIKRLCLVILIEAKYFSKMKTGTVMSCIKLVTWYFKDYYFCVS